ncbi:MAG: hydrogen gas-evolving membrane-bound hydrogenase subunit E, partial [Solimonas sp.]
GAAVAAALGAVWFHHERLVAVILAGVVGLAVSIAFAYFSAPDLALTQLSVEVVTTLLLLMALALLPQSTPAESPRRRKIRDAVLAVTAGAGVAALSWAVLTRGQESIAWYFLEHSLPRGGGGNVVNVLLVDFRGFDTFGEITVLSLAAMCAWILMAELRVERPPATRPPETDGIMFAVAARLLLPFAFLVAVYLFLRGHNQPGGGFLAGLVVAIALIMQYMGEGLQQTLTRIRIDFRILLGSGLLLAGLTGLAGILAGAPFLTGKAGHQHLPLLGEIPLASAMAFDLGVFMAVLGTTLLTLTALGQARRKLPPTGEVM